MHTINPKTGFTKNSKVLATSVVAKTCAEADAYATAFMAMDLDDTRKLLLISNIVGGPEVYIIYLNDKGATKEYMTPGFEALDFSVRLFGYDWDYFPFCQPIFFYITFR